MDAGEEGGLQNLVHLVGASYPDLAFPRSGTSISVGTMLTYQLSGIISLETVFSPIKILQYVGCDNKSELNLISALLGCLLED